MRSAIPYPQFVFFEEAKHPILTLTAVVPQTVVNGYQPQVARIATYGSPDSNSAQTASFGPAMPSTAEDHGKEIHATAVKINNLSTRWCRSRTVDLTGVNLIKEPYSAQVGFNLAQIQQRLPNSWQNIEVQMEVCDDTNQDGTCSDKG